MSNGWRVQGGGDPALTWAELTAPDGTVLMRFSASPGEPVLSFPMPASSWFPHLLTEAHEPTDA